MSGDEALAAARRRDLVSDGHTVGKISELLGPRWFGRGEERAIIEIEGGGFTVIPLTSLHVMTPGPRSSARPI